jgi:hypothetical protein
LTQRELGETLGFAAKSGGFCDAKRYWPVDDTGSHSRHRADNFRIAKILIQMSLDPDNITYDAIFNRLLEIGLANITLAAGSPARALVDLISSVQTVEIRAQ